MLNPGDEVSFSADHAVAGVRLDQVLSQRFTAYSRSYLSRAIERGAVRVDGVTAKASLKLKEGSVVCFTVQNLLAVDLKQRRCRLSFSLI